MKDDPIVEEVQQTRRRIYDECGGDLDRLIARLKAAETENGKRSVERPQPSQRRRNAKTRRVGKS